MKERYTFFQALTDAKGDLFKASQRWCAARGWYSTARVEWYEVWQTTDIPKEVEEADKKYNEA